MINPVATIPLPTAQNPTTALSEDPDPTMSLGTLETMSVHRATPATVRNPGHATVTPSARDLSELTPREREILILVAQGLSDRGISRCLCLTRKTVETHIRHVLTKLDLPRDGEHNRRVLAAVVYLTRPTPAILDPAQRATA
jgi:DNA-binding NarL/FixJ family response regulator